MTVLNEKLEDAKKYWLTKLSGDLSEVKLIPDFHDSVDGEVTIHQQVFRKETVDRLRRAGKNNELSQFVISLAALKIVLFKISGMEDIFVSSPVYGKGDIGDNKLVVFRDSLHPGMTFKELLTLVKDTVSLGYKNQFYPLKQIYTSLGVKSNFSRSTPVLAFEGVHREGPVTRVMENIEDGLVFSIKNRDGGLVCDVTYNSGFFSSDTVGGLSRAFGYVLDRVLENPGVTVTDVPLISSEEKSKLLFEFNRGQTAYSGGKTIHELFEAQAEKKPGALAVRSAVDLSDIFGALNSETVNPGIFRRLETCCFKKNKYLFQTHLSQLEKNNPFIFLKTCQHNIVVVNRNVLKLIDLLDGENSLGNVYSLVRSGGVPVEFLVYSINIDDVLEISYSSHKREEFILEDNFEDLFRLVKTLYNNNVIQLVNVMGMDSGTGAVTPRSPLNDYFDGPGALTGKEALGDLLGNKRDLSRADVLLLGDTPGQSTAGLLYLASYLKRNGIKAYAHFNDSNWETALLKRNIEELLVKIKPRIVGVSMKWFIHIARVLEICKIVKEYGKRNGLDIQLVLGGNSASYFHKDVIRSEYVDYIIRGDGELPFLKLCRGEKNIPNAVYKEGDRVIENPITYVQTHRNSSDIYLSHMDEIMISDYSCIFGIFFIFTQKGCRKNCHYCGGNNNAQRIAFNRPGLFRRNVSEVRKDIIESMKYSSTIYFLFDDYSNESLLDYCKKIWEGIDLSSHFGFLSNVIPPSPELIEYSNSVFKYVYWNIDMASMSERHRMRLFSEDIVKYQPTDREVLDMFEECEKYDNNEILINIITGLPYFDRDDIEAGREMLTYIMDNYSCFGEFFWGRLHAEPGASVIEDADKYGMYSLAHTFEDFLEYSSRSLRDFKFYPNVDDFTYPYVYFKDEELNSAVSQYYMETLKQCDQYVKNKRNRVFIYQNLSYRELNRRADGLAAELREKGVKPDTVVGVMTERSIEMIVGLLGVLKSGGAYLPIDPEYPAERIKYMMDDCNMKHLVARDHPGENVRFDGVVVDPGGINPVSNGGTARGGIGKESDLAYVIFTSGSTGKPKGVAVEHRSIVNTLSWRKDYYGFDENDVVLQIPSFSFDSSVEDIFTPLISGAGLVLIRQVYRLDLDYLRTYIKANGITHFLIVPALYATFLKNIPESLTGLRTVTVAGESFTGELVKTHFEKLKDVGLYNEYGPTENSVCTTVYRFNPDNPGVLIGHPIDNVKCYILNKKGELNPIGIPGELCIGGAGIARGYLNNPELTVEKFNRSYKSYKTYISYRTGDLARWLPGGNIEFLGRVDHQVKIRGYRVELGEIESRLLTHEHIDQVVVAVKEHARGDKYLCAYVVSQKNIEPSKLREFLLPRLPEYMIPVYFVRIERVPLTPNGKIDRDALPEPDASRRFEPPRDDVERRLVEIWAEALEIEKNEVGIDANFFEIGGHSLKATIIVSRIHKVFNVKMTLGQFFKTPTVKELADYIRHAARDRYAAIERVEKKEYYPLSSVQKRMYVLQEMEPDGTAYNTPLLIPLTDDLDLEKVKKAFGALSRRHDGFRTSFILVGEEPVQRVHDDVEFKIRYYDAGGIEDIKSFVRPFDLSRAPLWRVGVITSADSGRFLLVDMHHIITDATSHAVLEREFAALYAGEELPPLPLQYKDFSQWWNGMKQEKTVMGQERYWLEQFQGEIPALELPLDFPRPAVQRFEGNTVDFQLLPAQSDALNQLAEKEGTTLFMVLTAVFNVFLAKMTDREDIILGTPVVGRRHADLERIIGMFINTLALRNYPSGEKRFREFLSEVKGRTLEAFENQEYPFEDLVDRISLQRDVSRNPLFDVMLSWQNVRARFPGVPPGRKSREQKPLLPQTSQFDLTLLVVEADGELDFAFQYNTNLFKEETIRRFTGYIRQVISAAASNHECRLSDIEVMSEEEKQRVLSSFNDTRASYPHAAVIHSLFEEQAQRTPHFTAVISHAGHMTYGELNRRSEGLAFALRRKGIAPGALAGIMTDRSIEMITGIIALLKAGGAYLPIDPGYPRGRIRYILKESGARLLLTQRHLAKTLENPRFEGEIVDLRDKDLYTAAAHGESRGKRAHRTVSADLAYVIYTSGSTGNPRGVAIEHGSVVNFIEGMCRKIDFLPGKRILALTTISFDIFLLETLLPLVKGLGVVIASEDEQRDPGLLSHVIVKSGIRMMQVTPSTLKLLLNYDDRLACLQGVTELLVGGEAFPDRLFAVVKERFPGKLYNVYGPTETTVWSTLKELTQSGAVTVGGPIANTRVYIVDRSGKPRPIGAAGELLIAGDGVARGYLNNPDLTVEKFDTSCKSYESHRTYKTGDVAQWLPDGDIRFLGRRDYQVKIRGFRIELEEIEERLSGREDIAEAVVTAKTDENSDNFLCAYIVPVGGSKRMPAARDLREFLSRDLPAYMLPSYFVALDSIPLTPNGKLDRKALPGYGIGTDGKDRIPPRDELEEKLAGIWGDVLKTGKDAVGIDSNFFELGGHSLRAAMVTAKIHKELDVKIPMIEIFKAPFIRSLAQYIKRVEKNTYRAVEAVEKRAYYPLSPAQRGVFVQQQKQAGGLAYNMPQVLFLSAGIHRDRLEHAVKRLVQRHDILRASFHLVGDLPLQKVHDGVEFAIEFHDASGPGDSMQDIFMNFIRPFDLSRPPLLRVGLVNIRRDEYVLIVDMHHIITDGVSCEIFRRELTALYHDEELPSLRIQYSDYAVWRNTGNQRAEIDGQKEYWLETFKDPVPELTMPLDFERPAVKRFDGDIIHFTIGESLTGALKQLAEQTGATLYMILLSAYFILLFKYSGREDIVVGSPVTGRSHPDLQNMIGMFVNIMAVRNRPGPGKTFREFLAEVKKGIIDSMENQDYHFGELVLELGLQGNPGRNPLFDVVFTMAAGGPGEMETDEKEGTGDDNRAKAVLYEFEHKVIPFDLIMEAGEKNGIVEMNLAYSTTLYKRTSIEKMAEHFTRILNQAVDNDNLQLRDFLISDHLIAVNSGIGEVDLEEFEF